VRVAVLGAGLQGSCLALELSRRGVDVDLLDRADVPMTGASRHNEGKIHLGYVYANDPTRRTARTMIEGALEFGPLLRRWLGPAFDEIARSDPFVYLVHRDSLLGVPEVEQHFADCTAITHEVLDGREPDYFGADPRVLPRRLGADECALAFDPATVTAAYATEELAVEPLSLARAVVTTLDTDARVRLRMATEVRAVTRLDDGVVVHTDRADERYDHVVNALWDGRLAVDETAGLTAERPWLYRVKYFLRLRPGSSLPSTTIVLGPFGDVVTYDDGSMFLSWYPAGRLGTSAELRPPDWPVELEGVLAKEVSAGILDGLAEIVPGVSALSAAQAEGGRVLGGVIYAHGHTDIDDPASVLHERHEIGPVSLGRYHTVDTGKLTMAPRFARLTVEQILAGEAGA
jgi:glycine/D-amino acid oxidase-like deaminating enzyme